MRARRRQSQSRARSIPVRGRRPGDARAVADGEEGLILLTHLDRRGTVMLRYALGDVARLTRGALPALRRADRTADRLAAADRWASENQRDAGQSSGAGRCRPGRGRRCWISRPWSTRKIRAIRCRWTGWSCKIVRQPAAVPTWRDGLQRGVQRAIGVTPAVERIAGRRSALCPGAAGKPNRLSTWEAAKANLDGRAGHAHVRAARRVRRRSVPLRGPADLYAAEFQNVAAIRGQQRLPDVLLDHQHRLAAVRQATHDGEYEIDHARRQPD